MKLTRAMDGAPLSVMDGYGESQSEHLDQSGYRVCNLKGGVRALKNVYISWYYSKVLSL